MAKEILNYTAGQILDPNSYNVIREANSNKSKATQEAIEKLFEINDTIISFNKGKPLFIDDKETGKRKYTLGPQAQYENYAKIIKDNPEIVIPYRQMINLDKHQTMDTFLDFFKSEKNIGEMLNNHQATIMKQLQVTMDVSGQENAEKGEIIRAVINELQTKTKTYSVKNEEHFSRQFENTIRDLYDRKLLNNHQVNLMHEYMALERERAHFSTSLVMIKSANAIGDDVRQTARDAVNLYNKAYQAEQTFQKKLVDWSIKGYQSGKEAFNSLRESLDITNRVKNGFMSVIGAMRSGINKVKDFGDSVVNTMVQNAKISYDTSKAVAIDVVNFPTQKANELKEMTNKSSERITNLFKDAKDSVKNYANSKINALGESLISYANRDATKEQKNSAEEIAQWRANMSKILESGVSKDIKEKTEIKEETESTSNIKKSRA